MFDIYFSDAAALDGDYVYFYGDENDALDYYDKYGKNALVQLYAEQIASADPDAQITYGTPVFTEYQWNSFLKTDVVMTADLDGDGHQESRADTVFLTASMTSDANFVINEVLVFHNGYGLQLTQDQQMCIRDSERSFDNEHVCVRHADISRQGQCAKPHSGEHSDRGTCDTYGVHRPEPHLSRCPLSY